MFRSASGLWAAVRRRRGVSAGSFGAALLALALALHFALFDALLFAGLATSHEGWGIDGVRGELFGNADFGHFFLVSTVLGLN